MRLHIGKISPALAADPEVLTERLARFGELESKLELGRKSAGEYYFGFIDVSLDDKSFGALRSALNGTTFRQSQLTIERAKPKFEFKPSQDPADVEAHLNLRQLKRLRSRPPFQVDIHPGRHRQAPRDATKPATFRVIMKNGKLIKPRCLRTKLWGLSSKPPAELVHYFEDGVWRDANGKAVDYLSNSEQLRYKEILTGLSETTKQHGIDEPTAYLSDSDFDSFLNRHGEYEEMGQLDRDIELVPRGREPGVFVAPSRPNNTTEQLRDVLAAGDTQFTLFGAPTGPESNIDLPPSHVAEPEPIQLREPQLGLFFDHGESAFYTAQAQFSKLASKFDSAAWKELFYANRGSWNREIRRSSKVNAKRVHKQ